MKKIISIAVILVLIGFLSACQKEENAKETVIDLQTKTFVAGEELNLVATADNVIIQDAVFSIVTEGTTAAGTQITQNKLTATEVGTIIIKIDVVILGNELSKNVNVSVTAAPDKTVGLTTKSLKIGQELILSATLNGNPVTAGVTFSIVTDGTTAPGATLTDNKLTATNIGSIVVKVDVAEGTKIWTANVIVNVTLDALSAYKDDIRLAFLSLMNENYNNLNLTAEDFENEYEFMNYQELLDISLDLFDAFNYANFNRNEALNSLHFVQEMLSYEFSENPINDYFIVLTKYNNLDIDAYRLTKLALQLILIYDVSDNYVEIKENIELFEDVISTNLTLVLAIVNSLKADNLTDAINAILNIYGLEEGLKAADFEVIREELLAVLKEYKKALASINVNDSYDNIAELIKIYLGDTEEIMEIVDLLFGYIKDISLLDMQINLLEALDFNSYEAYFNLINDINNTEDPEAQIVKVIVLFSRFLVDSIGEPNFEGLAEKINTKLNEVLDALVGEDEDAFALIVAYLGELSINGISLLDYISEYFGIEDIEAFIDEFEANIRELYQLTDESIITLDILLDFAYLMLEYSTGMIVSSFEDIVDLACLMLEVQYDYFVTASKLDITDSEENIKELLENESIQAILGLLEMLASFINRPGEITSSNCLVCPECHYLNAEDSFCPDCGYDCSFYRIKE